MHLLQWRVTLHSLNFAPSASFYDQLSPTVREVMTRGGRRMMRRRSGGGEGANCSFEKTCCWAVRVLDHGPPHNTHEGQGEPWSRGRVQRVILSFIFCSAILYAYPLKCTRLAVALLRVARYVAFVDLAPSASFYDQLSPTVREVITREGV